MRKIYKYSEISEFVDPEEVDLSSFSPKDELNGNFWHDGRLDLYARKNLLLIAKSVIEGVDIEDMEIDDVIMTGSLANYNWDEKYSDIDLHIVLNFNEIADDVELVKKFFDTYKKLWNQKHEDGLRIYGYPVEIYFQDASESHTSSGVYSVLYDRWVVKPSRSKMKFDTANNTYIRKKASDFMTEIDDLEEELKNALNSRGSDYDTFMDIYDEADEIMERIKKTRKDSLSKDKAAEMSRGNIVFKSLRREGYIEKIFDIKTRCYDAANSI